MGSGMSDSEKVVLCYGILAVDQIVRPEVFPEPDGHARLLINEEFPGGESTNVAITLSCLGVSTRLMGSTLGDDGPGQWLQSRLRDTAVDCRLNVDPAIRTTQAIILSSQDQTRSIMGFFPDLTSLPIDKEDLQDVCLLSVDPFLGPSLDAARQAREEDIPVFSIEITEQHPLAELCQIVVLSRGFLRRHDCGDYEDVAVGLLKSGVQTVLVTQGAEGVSVFKEDGSTFHQQAYPVQVEDTTGAGDAFRAGLIYGYLKGWTLTRSVQFAAGCAAITCRHFGGGGHLRNEAEVMQLIGNA